MVLVLNLGLKSIRAIVFDIEGRKLASSARAVMTSLKDVRVEQNPEDWWNLGMQVMRDVLVEKEVRDSVRAVTVTTSSCCLIPVNEEGECLGPSMMVSDKRSEKESKKISDSLIFKGMAKTNGNLMAHPSMMLPKAMWLKNNREELYSNTKWLIGSNDYLINRICGVMATDVLNAEKFYYCPEKKDYPWDLFAEMGIEGKKLPEVVDPGTVLGEALDSFKESLNIPLSQSVKCVVTTYDAICAFFGSGLNKEGDASDVSGTVTSLRVLSKTRPKVQAKGIFVQYEPMTDVYVVGGSNNLGGGLIEWAKQCLYDGEEMPYEKMELEARASSLGAKGITFLPYLLGERAPIWDDNARAVFFGVERHHKRGDMIRAVFESTGLSLVPLMRLIDECGCAPKRLVASGGLARMALISQIKADVLGAEVCIPSEFETTAVGAHIMTVLGLKEYTDLSEASSIVTLREVILPDGRRKDSYNQIFDIYWELYSSLKDLFVKRQDVLKSIGAKETVRIENL